MPLPIELPTKAASSGEIANKAMPTTKDGVDPTRLRLMMLTSRTFPRRFAFDPKRRCQRPRPIMISGLRRSEFGRIERLDAERFAHQRDVENSEELRRDEESAQPLAAIASGEIDAPPSIARDRLERFRLSLPVEQIRRRCGLYA